MGCIIQMDTKKQKSLHTTNKELCGDLVELCNSIGRITNIG